MISLLNNTGYLIRCVAAKGEDAPECDKFAKYYRSLCPGEWVCIYCFHHYGLHSALVACGVEIRKKYFLRHVDYAFRVDKHSLYSSTQCLAV